MTATKLRTPRTPRHRFPAWMPLLVALTLTACESAPPEPVGRMTAIPESLSLAHGDAVDLILRFEPTAELGADAQPMVFVHLIDTEGRVVLTADHALPGTWQTGQTLDDPVRLYHSALAPALPAGSYRLTAGLYQDKERWSLDSGEATARQEYHVASVEVPAQDSTFDATFSSTWMPASLGTDRQVTARRWLTEGGSLSVAVEAEPMPIALELQIPTPAEGQQLVLEDGATAPQVTLGASCSGFTTTLTGSGNHRIDVPTAPATDGASEDTADETSTDTAAGDTPSDPTGADDSATDGQATDAEVTSEGICTLTFEANYQLVDTKTFSTATLSLEQLAWRRAPHPNG